MFKRAVVVSLFVCFVFLFFFFNLTVSVLVEASERLSRQAKKVASKGVFI